MPGTAFESTVQMYICNLPPCLWLCPLMCTKQNKKINAIGLPWYYYLFLNE